MKIDDFDECAGKTAKGNAERDTETKRSRMILNANFNGFKNLYQILRVIDKIWTFEILFLWSDFWFEYFY